MDLHSDIMNIRVDEQDLRENLPGPSFAAYKVGHRDARHAAAELSLKADARIEDLEQALEHILSSFKSVLGGKCVRDADETISHIEKLLGE